MKLSIAVVLCPRCSWPLSAKDMEDMKIYEAKCPQCVLEVEVVPSQLGGPAEVKRKTIN